MTLHRSKPAAVIRHRRSLRPGVTLLEVMISLMVLSVGMLGLAALIPLGQYEMMEATKADRSAVIGRASIRNLKASGALDPHNWLYKSGSQFSPVVGAGSGGLALRSPPGGGLPPFQGPVVLDPLMTAYNPTHSGAQTFPYNTSYVSGSPPVLPRITLRAIFNTTLTTPMGYLAADRFFRSTDDVVFEVPDKKEDYPIAMFNTVTISNTDIKIKRQSSGAFSWFAVISPDINEVNSSGAFLTSDLRQFYVTVVAFYKRPMVDLSVDAGDAAPSERMVNVQFVGGGDVLLSVSNCDQSKTAEKLLDVKTEQWLMVISPGMTANGRNAVQWYRVLSAASEVESTGSSTWSRSVRLVGRDWNSGTTAYGVIIDGTIGVFERTVVMNTSTHMPD